MKIAALYARVSTTNQQQNETIASQLDALMPMLVPMTMRSVPITSTKTRALVAPLSIDRRSMPWTRRVTNAVSSKTTALIVGEEPGASKLTKAQRLGIELLDEAAFEKLLGG